MATEEGSLVVPDAPLPAIRDDVELIRGARTWNGEPGWTLHDRVRNQFFQVSELDFHVLSCWTHGKASEVAAAATVAAGEPVDIDYLEGLTRFLLNSELLDASTQSLRQRLAMVQKARQHSFWQFLLHKYLYFRVPLVKPDRFLEHLYPHVRFLFNPLFFWVTALSGLTGLLLLIMNWESFSATFPWFFTPVGALVFAGTLVFAKVMHEMGHALVCKHFGLRIPAMGVAFLVMWPVLYTDATDAWRLDSRRKRVTIAAAGIMAETALACYALLAWFLLPDGLARSVAFTLATTTWLLSIVVNLNPLMRFDGYYLLSDGLNIANLQDRSFAVARWKLRRLLFGIADPCPEDLPRRLINFLIGYGWAVWLYRFFLFLGIAILVYQFFFKALGLFLFGVEIWWFVLGPIMREVTAWRSLHQGLSTWRVRAYAAAGLALVVLLAVPWHTDIEVPALLSAARYQSEYPVVPAQVIALNVRDGQEVQAGDVLLELSSDSLDFQLRAAGLDLAKVQGALARRSVDEDFHDRLVLEQQSDQASGLVEGLGRAQARLSVTADFAGVVRDLDPSLRVGRWVTTHESLLTLVGGEGLRVIGWVPESERDRVRLGDRALFYGDNGFGSQAVKLVVTGVETSSVRNLSPPYQASLYGGRIPATRGEGGVIVPEQSVYRVHLRPLETGASGLEARVRGTVIIAGERSSILGSLLEAALSLVVRESGL